MKVIKLKKRIMVVLTVMIFLSTTCIASAAVYLNVYGSLTSGNWNPFLTDVAATYAFVGWEDSISNDNDGSVLATIYWTDKEGNSRATTNTLTFSDISGATETVKAESGNDDSTASSYHYGYMVDNRTGKSYSGTGRFTE